MEDLDLENSEIFLVQVPKDVNVSEAVVSSKNRVVIGKNTYSLEPAEAPLGTCEVLTPKSSKSSKLRVSGSRPVQLLTLARAAKKLKAKKLKSQSKPTVPQKTGLRVRHFATGYSC